MNRLAVGCMTGTSLDSLDAALVGIEGSGLSLRARFHRGVSHGLDGLAPRLRAVAEQQPTTAAQVAALSRDFALAHVAAVSVLLAGERADLVSVHGQTVHHAPPVSWQLLNPWPIAHELRAPVVFDLRGADLAAGGQGAPITPLADLLLFADPVQSLAVVNLGGFCNITLLPPRGEHTDSAARDVRGMDVCACNHLLDGLSRTLLGAPYDDAGAAASSGAVNERLAAPLADLLTSQAAAGRSLGTGDELSRWIEGARRAAPAPDVLRSACEALARAIVKASTLDHAVTRPPLSLILAGGGVRNLCLMRALESHAGRPVRTTADLGVPPEYREAACMAVLGALCQDRVPITLPQVTGVRHPAPVAGCWASP
jgi:1,6-anhydro-N-acetylmuramate kinase